MIFINTDENIIRYENPMLTLRRDQIVDVKYGCNKKTMKEIFESIPMNFRKIFMFDVDFKTAISLCGSEFNNRMLKCIEYCIKVIG